MKKIYDKGMKIRIDEKEEYIVSITNYDFDFNIAYFNIINLETGIRFFQEPITLEELNSELQNLDRKIEIIK